MNNFQEKLHKLRLAKEETQANLAKKCNLSKRQLIRYEQGESEPTLSALISLADYFNISLDELVGRTYPSEK